MSKTKLTLLPFVLLIGGFTIAPVVANGQSSQSAATLQNEIMNKALNKPKFKSVQVSLSDGIATLTGTDDVFDLKEEADR